MYDIFDDTFDLENTKNYNLSIQVSLGGFSYSIIDPNKNQLVALKNNPLKISSEAFIARRLTEWIENEKWLQNTFQKTRIIVYTENFALIPENLFEPEQKDTVIHSLFETNSRNKIEKNLLQNIHAKLLFVLPFQLETVFGENNTGFSMVHPLTLITGKLPQSKKENSLIVLFEHSYLYTVLYKNNEILHTNRFSIKHINDIIYYILNIFNQLKISRKQTDLFVGGRLNITDDPKKVLIRYFDEINLINHTGLEINPDLKKNWLYTYFPLLLFS